MLWNTYQFLADCDRSKRTKGKAAWFFVCVYLWTVLKWWQASHRLYSIVHVAMETTKTSHLTCQSNSLISIFFTCQVLACELQSFSCLDLANDIYSQTAKTVFSHQMVQQRLDQVTDSFGLADCQELVNFFSLFWPVKNVETWQRKNIFGTSTWSGHCPKFHFERCYHS